MAMPASYLLSSTNDLQIIISHFLLTVNETFNGLWGIPIKIRSWCTHDATISGRMTLFYPTLLHNFLILILNATFDGLKCFFAQMGHILDTIYWWESLFQALSMWPLFRTSVIKRREKMGWWIQSSICRLSWNNSASGFYSSFIQVWLLRNPIIYITTLQDLMQLLEVLWITRVHILIRHFLLFMKYNTFMKNVSIFAHRCVRSTSDRMATHLSALFLIMVFHYFLVVFISRIRVNTVHKKENGISVTLHIALRNKLNVHVRQSLLKDRELHFIVEQKSQMEIWIQTFPVGYEGWTFLPGRTENPSGLWTWTGCGHPRVKTHLKVLGAEMYSISRYIQSLSDMAEIFHRHFRKKNNINTRARSFLMNVELWNSW